MICTEAGTENREKGRADRTGVWPFNPNRLAGAWASGQAGKGDGQTFNKLLFKVYENSDGLGEAGKPLAQENFCRKKKEIFAWISGVFWTLRGHLRASIMKGYGTFSGRKGQDLAVAFWAMPSSSKLGGTAHGAQRKTGRSRWRGKNY